MSNTFNPDLSLGFCDEGLKYNLPAGKAGKIRCLGEPACRQAGKHSLSYADEPTLC